MINEAFAAGLLPERSPVQSISSKERQVLVVDCVASSKPVFLVNGIGDKHCCAGASLSAILLGQPHE